jgi:MFS family permease
MLCCSSLLFFASFNMIVPELPSFLTSLGGAEHKGLIIAMFTITAMVSRPFSGKLADTIGRVPIVMIGSIVCFACSLIYPMLSTVAAFLALRLMHGFSTGFTPTGQSAYISDIIPHNKRGEAMGFLGTAGMMGMAGGPALADPIVRYFGLYTVFYCSALFALLSLAILYNLRETLQQKQKFSLSALAIEKTDLFEPRVLTPCLVMLLCAYSYGATITLLPDLGQHLGMANKGVSFTCFTVASFAIRLIGGKASDRFGRRKILVLSSLGIVAGMITLATATTPFQLLVGVSLYGLAQGATSPTLLAWATDLSDLKYKGRGIASLYIFMELGIGIGAFASGLLYGNDSSNFFVTFTACGLLALMAFFYLIISRQRIPQAS